MQLFDTHAHIGLLQDDKMEQLLAVQMAKVKSVRHVVSICNSLADFERTYANLESSDSVFHAVGVSPTEVTNPGKDWEERVIAHAHKRGVVAIGETGLDYFHMFGGDKTLQIELMLKDQLFQPISAKDLGGLAAIRTAEILHVFHHSQDRKLQLLGKIYGFLHIQYRQILRRGHDNRSVHCAHCLHDG